MNTPGPDDAETARMIREYARRRAGIGVILIAVAWSALWAVSFTALQARSAYNCHHDFSNICDRRLVRKETGINAMTSFFPPGWLAALIVTGGYTDGVMWSYEPAIDR